LTAIYNRVLGFSQWLNRRFNSAYRESLYQSSYLDLARRTDWLREVPLASPDGGTASFSFLYVLLRILRERCVCNILELGVGQSSKLLIQYTRTFNKSLTLVDQDESWLCRVTQDAPRVKTIHAPLLKCHVAGKLIR